MKPKTMSKEAKDFFRKEKIARSEGIVKKLNKISNFDIEGEILEAYAKEQTKELEKNKLDLLNWAKGELANEENPKLAKTMTPYRTDKIKFLRRAIKIMGSYFK